MPARLPACPCMPPFLRPPPLPLTNRRAASPRAPSWSRWGRGAAGTRWSSASRSRACWAWGRWPSAWPSECSSAPPACLPASHAAVLLRSACGGQPLWQAEGRPPWPQRRPSSFVASPPLSQEEPGGHIQSNAGHHRGVRCPSDAPPQAWRLSRRTVACRPRPPLTRGSLCPALTTSQTAPSRWMRLREELLQTPHGRERLLAGRPRVEGVEWMEEHADAVRQVGAGSGSRAGRTVASALLCLCAGGAQLGDLPPLKAPVPCLCLWMLCRSTGSAATAAPRSSARARRRQQAIRGCRLAPPPRRQAPLLPRQAPHLWPRERGRTALPPLLQSIPRATLGPRGG